MLILPLHRRMTGANFPYVTFLLVALNCLVFFFLQSGDRAILHQASQYYLHAHIGKVEFPAYRHWLAEHGAKPKQRELMRNGPRLVRYMLVESDPKFQAALHAGEVIQPNSPHYASWHEKRLRYDKLRNRAFTPSHAVRYSHVEPRRIAWGMFMHGSFMHLFGNMLFLLVIGFLVEGALGRWRYLLLYLTGGYVAALASLGLHWGDYGLLLGASGAIASLMGAFCVLWGLRKVRVFYWFLVVFDYVRIPALVLLPVWFGWQLFSLLTSAHAHVAFGAHAAGILFGAGLAAVLRRTGQVHGDFIAEDERVEAHEQMQARLAEAMECIGHLEIGRARQLLNTVDAAEPGQLQVAIGLYRCARYQGTTEALT